MTSEVRISSQRSEVNYSFSLLTTTYMAIFPRIIFGLLRHKYIPCRKHERKLTLSDVWWSNSVHGYYISPYLKYRKVFFPSPNFILRNMVTAFFHPHILSSAFCHPHIIIRRHPVCALQRPLKITMFLFLFCQTCFILQNVFEKKNGINTKIACIIN